MSTWMVERDQVERHVSRWSVQADWSWPLSGEGGPVSSPPDSSISPELGLPNAGTASKVIFLLFQCTAFDSFIVFLLSSDTVSSLGQPHPVLVTQLHVFHIFVPWFLFPVLPVSPARIAIAPSLLHAGCHHSLHLSLSSSQYNIDSRHPHEHGLSQPAASSRISSQAVLAAC